MKMGFSCVRAALSGITMRPMLPCRVADDFTTAQGVKSGGDPSGSGDGVNSREPQDLAASS
jgi:hypothetical protein